MIIDNINNYLYILRGLLVTISVSLGCFVFGVLFGVLFGLGIYLTSSHVENKNQIVIYKLLRLIQRFFINTPIISQVFIAYFVLSMSNSLVLISIVVLGINSAAHISVIVLEYLNNISRVYWETAYSLGFTPLIAFYRIFLKEMFFFCEKSFFGELIALVKESALLSFFGVKDICFRSKEVGLRLYNFTPYIVFASLVYFVLIWIMELLYSRYHKYRHSLALNMKK